MTIKLVVFFIIVYLIMSDRALLYNDYEEENIDIDIDELQEDEHYFHKYVPIYVFIERERLLFHDNDEYVIPPRYLDPWLDINEDHKLESQTKCEYKSYDSHSKQKLK
jgi:hypothetical protein